MSRKRIFATLLTASVLCFPLASRAEVSMSQFQANGYAASQASGGNTISGQLSWNPELELGTIALRGNLGAAVLKGLFDNKFVAINYQALASYRGLSPFALEAGGGLQTWMKNGGTHPILSANVAYGLGGMINRLFIGYSRFLLTNNATNEFRAGLGIAL
jgi:hypothetical protein